MAETKVLQHAEIRDRDNTVVLVLADRGLDALRITVDLDNDRKVELIEPIPIKRPDWLIGMLGELAQRTVTATLEVLNG